MPDYFFQNSCNKNDVCFALSPSFFALLLKIQKTKTTLLKKQAIDTEKNWAAFKRNFRPLRRHPEAMASRHPA